MLKREHTIKHEDLLGWLAAYPSLLILDGLDEVPKTSNRDALVSAVSDFLAEARQVEADLFAVATSRQQGYGGEFASGVVEFRHILPLSRARALQYVEHYAEARFGTTNPTRAQDLVEKLRESAQRELTGQLMSSPLQVTFMATVVAARGDPGEDRWQLFDSYYRTIYDRERQKAVPPYDSVLSKQQAIIDRLHHDIGFWLQNQGEASSSSAVSLPMSQFEGLVHAYLNEIGHQGDEKANLVKLITESAHQRLVFLVSRVEGELSFEVRSLQEYMAAECLMTGSHELVKSRLRAIAPAPYWRNVFLFAAGKCFADTRSRYLQDTIRLLCVDLNNADDALLDLTRAGSELALDVLQSGALSENPNYSRHLTRIALNLLVQPNLIDARVDGATFDDRLSIVFREQTAIVYEEELRLRVGQSNVKRTLGAWCLLVRLVERRVDWAVALAEQSWPPGYRDQHALLECLLHEIEILPSHWLNTKLVSLITQQPPKNTWSILASLRLPHSTHADESDSLVESLCRLRDLSMKEISLLFKEASKEGGGLKLRFVPLFPEDDVILNLYTSLAKMQPTAIGWTPILLANELIRKPDRQTLASVLRQCAEDSLDLSEYKYLPIVPWPLADCLATAESIEDLRRLADLAEKGELGDTEIWRVAEARWKKHGVSREDILYRSSGLEPFDDSTAMRRSPSYWPSQSITNARYSDNLLAELVSILRALPTIRQKSAFIWFLFLASEETGGLLRCLEPNELRALIEDTDTRAKWHQNVVACPEDPVLRLRWVEFFEWLGRSDRLSPYFEGNKICDCWREPWENEFIQRPSQVGILRLLGRLASVGHLIDIPSKVLDVPPSTDPRFRLASLLVRLTQPSLSETDATNLAIHAVTLLEPQAEEKADMLIFQTASRHLDKVAAIGRFLIELHSRIPPSVELGQAKCEQLLRRVLRRRPSDLQIPGECEKLQLPQVPTE